MITLTCEHCGKQFQRHEAHQHGKRIYCSVECYHLADRRKQYFCRVCGKQFQPAKWPAWHSVVYCSEECSQKGQDQAMQETKIEKVCPRCGKTFSVNKSMADRYTVCSRECKTTREIRTCKRCGKAFYYSAADRKRGLSRWYCSEECRRPPVYVTCEQCGKKFRETPKAAEEKRFCSFACYRRATGETSIEAKMREALDAIGLNYSQEFTIGRYTVDFAVVDGKFAIEADGEYWHRNSEKDRRRDSYLAKYGWLVIRFSEREIKASPNLSELVINRIKEVTGSDFISA